MKTPQRLLVEKALSQVGYAADAGKRNKYAKALDALGVVYNGPKNGFDWCDVFADWCFVDSFGLETALSMICQPRLSAGAGCPYSASYYRSAGRWSASPQLGAQVFFGSGIGRESHTGIVVEVYGSSIMTVEGNTGGGSGSVNRRGYSRGTSRIVGYGIPRWEFVNLALREDEVFDFENISIGDQGDAVRLMQSALNIRTGCALVVDGLFGSITNSALRSFQETVGIVVDGVCGPITWGRLLGR